MRQSIPGTSCSTKRTCGQTISRIFDVNQHLVSLFGHRSRHNLTKKWGMIFGSKLREKKDRRFTSRGESGWGIINSQPLFAPWDILQKRARLWLLGPTGSEECLLEFRLKLWTRTIRRMQGGVCRSPTGTIWGLEWCLYTNLMEFASPPNCIKATKNEKSHQL